MMEISLKWCVLCVSLSFVCDVGAAVVNPKFEDYRAEIIFSVLIMY